MRVRVALLLSLAVPAIVLAQGRRASSIATTARYRVRIEPSADMFEVRAEFDLAASQDTVLLSLPAWSPGSYDVDNYARWVHNVRAEAGGHPVFWDNGNKDTWPIWPGGPRAVAPRF